jgi:hypothetical protein
MATFSLNASIGGSSAAVSLNASNPLTLSTGLTANSTPSADGNGLPFTKITPEVSGQIIRNIITWFVPQFGTVRMFINPQNIVYQNKKAITKDRTKGGFTLQYWGEDLTTLKISGNTGSSGIEGINMLYEIYRAEQLSFDAVGLSLAANNASADLSNNLSVGIGGALSQTIGGSNLSAPSSGGILGGILGMDSPNAMLSPRNIPSLATMAFGVEMYYNGWVYRGFFEDMNVTESADDFLLKYDITFTVTQRRGYRTNYFPWHESPVSGPSNYTTPYSFNGTVMAPQPAPTTSLASLLTSLL